MTRKNSINILPNSTHYDEIDSPVGKLIIITSAQGLHAILWDVNRNNLYYEKMMSKLTQSKNEKTILRTKQQLQEYFCGQRKTFKLPLVLAGTEFQLQAWQQLLKVPYAQTISYGEQAQKLGDKKKARAVGMANGCNPISIVIPCHRVIGSNGQLVGFGGGIERKQWLLDHEKNCKKL